MKLIKTKYRYGMTVVELLVVTVIAMIVLLSVGSGLVAGNRCWNEAWKKVNLQRDASYAMNIISRPVKEATSVTVGQDDDSVLTINSQNGSRMTFSLGSDTPEAKRLQRQIAELNPHKIIGNVEDLVFNVDGNRVRVFIRLKQDDIEVALDSTIMMRNYGL
jgi:type II secretory pathway pseudopilin PulG